MVFGTLSDSPLELVDPRGSAKKQTVVATSTTEDLNMGGCKMLLTSLTHCDPKPNEGSVKIHASIDGHSLSISEGSLRRHLKLDDQDGITSLPPTEIFAQLALMGYVTNSDKLTFQKGAFSPQWRFLIHNILHCLSPENCLGAFSSNIAGQEVELFPNMLNAVESSPSRSTSSPSPTPTSSPTPESTHAPPSPQPPTPQPSPPQPSPTHLGSDYHPPTPHDSPLHAVHSHGSDEGSLKLQELMTLVTILSDRVGVLEA
ncbi:hypothetical protein Tco_0706619 [Tanacetum coccineum]|uniref:Uncharacterized protein n=1 Tax=Tanacetum coccineum TaxID=301880 RepID=A0ABQ4Y9G8_9ASTR